MEPSKPIADVTPPAALAAAAEPVPIAEPPKELEFEEVPADSAPDTVAIADPVATANADAPRLAPAPEPPRMKQSTPKGAGVPIAVAIALFILLSATAFYAYLNSK